MSQGFKRSLPCLVYQIFLKNVCKYTIKPLNMSTFPPVKHKLMGVIYASALSLPKTGKITKKTKFILRASFRYKRGRWKGEMCWGVKSFLESKVLWFNFMFLQLITFLVSTCSLSNNLIQLTSQVLIGPQLTFCLPTSPTCCNLSRKCTLVKWKVRQKIGYPSVK